MDWLNLLAAQETLKSLLQHYGSNLFRLKLFVQNSIDLNEHMKMQ